MISSNSPISLEKRKLAAVSYIPLIGPIVFYGHRADSFIAFHATQGTAASLYIITAYFIPTVGPYFALGFAAVAVAGFLHALHGQEYRILGLGQFITWLLKK